MLVFVNNSALQSCVVGVQNLGVGFGAYVRPEERPVVGVELKRSSPVLRRATENPKGLFVYRTLHRGLGLRERGAAGFSVSCAL